MGGSGQGEGPAHLDRDKIFLDLLAREVPFFYLKLSYEGDTLVQAVLNGKELSTEI